MNDGFSVYQTFIQVWIQVHGGGGRTIELFNTPM